MLTLSLPLSLKLKLKLFSNPILNHTLLDWLLFIEECFNIISEEFLPAKEKIVYKTEPVSKELLVEGTPDIFKDLSIEERYIFVYATFWKKYGYERQYIKSDESSNKYYDIKNDKFNSKKAGNYTENIARAD